MCFDYDKVEEIIETATDLVEAATSPFDDDDDDLTPSAYTIERTPPDDDDAGYPEIIDNTGAEYPDYTFTYEDGEIKRGS